MPGRRDPQDLVKSPPGQLRRDPEPLTVVLKNLATTSGVELEIFTQTTPTLARAALLGYIFDTMIVDEGQTSPGCPYVHGRIEQVERFAISMDGRGRADQIAALHSDRPQQAEKETFVAEDH